MKRKTFIKALALAPLAGFSMSFKSLRSLGGLSDEPSLMPVLFVGHGSPMNAIEKNEFSLNWKKLGQKLPRPKAILCISAHWETKGTYVTAMPKPKTIHDFGGFPNALFEIHYPAQGLPELAQETQRLVKGTQVGLDESWGLDHGCWSILNPMFPEADIPVLQMSIDYRKPPLYHYELARELAFLRRKGVLIVGSGNLVHNLKVIAWDKIQEPEYGYDWALEANELFKSLIESKDYKKLSDYSTLGKAVKMSVPTPDHFLPALYALALQGKGEELSFFNDKTVMGSISMTSFVVGKV
ncbi:4,5-DOPA dioxygenase extradiol [Cytophagaceae bacterium ABcell3]|nr:4,5-DOPA dioxygenase extradiol [Cytophagaceae bacterium ABcell3]